MSIGMLVGFVKELAIGTLVTMLNWITREILLSVVTKIVMYVQYVNLFLACQILTKSGIFRQILVKTQNVAFLENISCGSQVVAGRQAGRQADRWTDLQK
jgi:hypothetical protein